ncbi:MAG: acyltransferase family protein [Bacteroidota bacterium]|jgi:peptidoglycan/LPS O-acetylase OafA/YrhL|nr:acyltransferase family protein [Bacteroidota bacterium]
MENGNTQRIYFKNLDILRFLAAYMIVLLHCFFGWQIKFGNPKGLVDSFSPASIEKFELVMHNFSFGVDIFFIVSGFLLTYLLLAEKEKTGKVDVIKFYIRRAFRIWPLYFFMILLAPLLSYFLYEQSPTYLYHFLFAGNFDLIENGPKSVATNHLWSICIEEHFYLFCPLLIGFIPMKKLPQTLLSIILVCIIFRGFFLNSTSDYGMSYYVHTLSRIDILALGGLFGYLYYHKRIKFNHSLSVRLIIYTLFLLIFFNVNYVESGSFLIDTMKKYLFVIPFSYWLGNFLFHKNAVFAVDRPNIFHLFGKVSYGIYMFNPVIIFLVICLFEKYGVQNYLYFLVAVHVLLAISTYLSYRFLEMPFLALKERYAVIQSGASSKSAEEQLEEGNVQDYVPEIIIADVNTKND